MNTVKQFVLDNKNKLASEMYWGWMLKHGVVRIQYSMGKPEYAVVPDTTSDRKELTFNEYKRVRDMWDVYTLELAKTEYVKKLAEESRLKELDAMSHD